MITFNKVYIEVGKITHLSLHILLSVFNLKNASKFLKNNMKNYDFSEKQLQISDPIESYFECISSCDIRDGTCVSKCVEILKKFEN